jgi:hypothetical protein
MTIGDWTNRFDGVLIDALQYEADPGTTSEDYLVRLNPPTDRTVSPGFSRPVLFLNFCEKNAIKRTW